MRRKSKLHNKQRRKRNCVVHNWHAMHNVLQHARRRKKLQRKQRQRKRRQGWPETKRCASSGNKNLLESADPAAKQSKRRLHESPHWSRQSSSSDNAVGVHRPPALVTQTCTFTVRARRGRLYPWRRTAPAQFESVLFGHRCRCPGLGATAVRLPHRESRRHHRWCRCCN